MEIDFKSIRALSSPTRLKILRRVLEKESTTTQLSEELDRSKSTISSHLKELTEAGLVEKDQKKGRRRVVYSPTRKADAIVNGKERKVKFSIGSSVLTAVAGTFLIWKDFARKTAGEAVKAAPTASPQAGGGQMETFKAMDAANATREAANTTAQKAAEASHGMGLEQFFLFLGVGLLAVSASTLIYGIALNHLGSFDSEEETVEVK